MKEEISSPTKSIKEEIAKQLFGTSSSVSTTQRNKKVLSSRKPKKEKTEFRKASKDLLDLCDVGESADSSTNEWFKQDCPDTLDRNIPHDPLMDLDVRLTELLPVKWKPFQMQWDVAIG